MKAYQVTFVADYFVLSTTIGVDYDVEISRDSVIYRANEQVRNNYGFSPQEFAFDIEIEERD
jgi:hypothetical protein